MDANEAYRYWLHSRHLDCLWYESGDDVPLTASCAKLKRVGTSHRGIEGRLSLRQLEAHGVNQEFLERISELKSLEYLELAYPVTAKDFSPIAKLQSLRILKINSPRAINDFSEITNLRCLERLFIENAKLMPNLEWLRPLKDQLTVLGIEGGMWSTQKIPSLRPLEGFQLEALFLSSTRIGDKSLSALRSMKSLRYLGTAQNVSRAEFMSLQGALPELECPWFHQSTWDAAKGGAY